MEIWHLPFPLCFILHVGKRVVLVRQLGGRSLTVLLGPYPPGSCLFWTSTCWTPTHPIRSSKQNESRQCKSWSGFPSFAFSNINSFSSLLSTGTVLPMLLVWIKLLSRPVRKMFASLLPRIWSFSLVCYDNSGGPVSLGFIVLCDMIILTTLLADLGQLPGQAALWHFQIRQHY